jgi:hypothetical protein
VILVVRAAAGAVAGGIRAQRRTLHAGDNEGAILALLNEASRHKGLEKLGKLKRLLQGIKGRFLLCLHQASGLPGWRGFFLFAYGLGLRVHGDIPFLRWIRRFSPGLTREWAWPKQRGLREITNAWLCHHVFP